MQRAPLEAIELRSGAELAQRNSGFAGGQETEARVGWARRVSQVCTDTQSMSAVKAGRPSERTGKGD